MAESTRRSGRQRRVNPKYAHDGWDKETLRILRASSESSGSSPDESSQSGDLQEDDDFITAQADAAPDISSQGETASAFLTQSSDVDTHDEEEDDQIRVSSDENIPDAPRMRNNIRSVYANAASTTAHSRGLQSGHHLRAKGSAYPITFGPEIGDLFDVLQARDTWLKGRDVTIPSRRTLSAAIKAPSFSRKCSVETRQESGAEDTKTLDSLPLGESISRNQLAQEIPEEDLYSKYLLRGRPSHSIIIGPRGNQRKIALDYLSALDFGQAWVKYSEQEITQTVPSRYHEGWLVNVGDKVQSLAWAPSDGPVQYLAAAVRCSSTQRRLACEEERDRPAFYSSPPYPSSIQIWAFHTKSTEYPGVRKLSMNTEPYLSIVLATEWGNIRQLKWCPVDRVRGMGDEQEHPGKTTTDIHVLGVISSDGCARVLAVPLPAGSGSVTSTSLRMERAGIILRPPPETIFTTLAFMSPTDLILGAGDGSVHLFDLTEQAHDDGTCRSYVRHQLHHTCVIALCAALPSPFSTFVASTSASGDLMLTDLRNPDQDRISLPRACFPNRDLIFSPFSRSFLTALDRAGNTRLEANSATFVVCHHLRQFPNSLKVAKLPDYSGAATALAGSRWHPSIVVGNARGQIFATNYLRRVLPYRKNAPRQAASAYLQKICEYDWRALAVEEGGQKENTLGKRKDIDLYHGQDAKAGVSRFDEGFKLEKIEVGNVPPSKKKSQRMEVGATEAIFEEEQAVTAIDWNPNAPCAGLVAIGWGSGIFRVQDLAHDAE
ncbi:uncharacterized protein Z518_11179 [Rhinocladiella mackenziei CBS 650.93]|uniref:WD40 repeat-like protein n=1 Tax=Rhinocladiella mackenziei CBS 650.93 TaxID=1442369 RepID=A0A0D2I874_9EURO|nr:uncharacterized protein Z518_11179 [Rhinocladiella mackenziei CBS 650.93]KIW99440.1 hypothetical protein Z518_11179 [Rhinocladiella mackenziei CBS 650.93]